MRLLRAILIGCLGAALGGCAGYRLGPSNGLAAGAKSVSIVPFANKTLEPRLGDAVTGALRKELQRDATFTLATHDAGDVIVSGVVTGYLREERSLVPNDVITARDYRVSLTAQVTARERATGKVLLDKPVTGYTLMRIGSDLPGGDRQALPLLAADLARQVTSLLADGNW